MGRGEGRAGWREYEKENKRYKEIRSFESQNTNYCIAIIAIMAIVTHIWGDMVKEIYM